MKIYESGKSVCKDLLGYKDNKNKNYVCVIDNQSLPVEEAFIEMRKNLYDLGIKEEDLLHLTISTENDTYALAHERTFDRKGNIILTTSNLLRYLFTRNFSIETLYYNEDRELIDIMDATGDVVNQQLRSVLPYDTIISYDNNILLETMYLRICKNWRLSQDIDAIWQYMPRTVKPLTGENTWFNKILKGAAINSIIHTIAHYDGLTKYFYAHSGMNITALFTPNEKYIKQQQEEFKLMLQQPPKSQVKPQPKIDKGLDPSKTNYGTKGIYEQLKSPKFYNSKRNPHTGTIDPYPKNTELVDPYPNVGSVTTTPAATPIINYRWITVDGEEFDEPREKEIKQPLASKQSEPFLESQTARLGAHAEYAQYLKSGKSLRYNE